MGARTDEAVPGAGGGEATAGPAGDGATYERDLVRLIYAASDLSALATRLLTGPPPSAETARVVSATADFAEASAGFLRRAGRARPAT